MWQTKVTWYAATKEAKDGTFDTFDAKQKNKGAAQRAQRTENLKFAMQTQTPNLRWA